MKIRLIAIALTMLMIISGFAVLVSYAPANNSIPVSPVAVPQGISYNATVFSGQFNNRSVWNITSDSMSSVSFSSNTATATNSGTGVEGMTMVANYTVENKTTLVAVLSWSASSTVGGTPSTTVGFGNATAGLTAGAILNDNVPAVYYNSFGGQGTEIESMSGAASGGDGAAAAFAITVNITYANGTVYLNNSNFGVNFHKQMNGTVHPIVYFGLHGTYSVSVLSLYVTHKISSAPVISSGNYILFNETGLPYGQSWNVALTNKTVNVVNSVYTSTTNTVKAFLPTGYNYSFNFSTFDKSYYKIVNLTGNVYLSSQANATVNVTLTNVSYDVVFHESGIVSGNAWGINFNGTDYNTTSASLTFIEKNGSYPFTVIISNLYNSNVSSGYANVSGQSLNFYIGFTYHAFNITFSEVGLPSNVQWSMTINGTVYYSNVSDSNILLFQGKIGSYDGIVNNASYYIPVTKYFNFTISGNAQYTIDYGIILTFIESGYNGLWHITINGVTYSSSTNTIVATVSPGQVIFNVWGISGYTINPEVVTQSYTSAQTIRVAFTVQPASFENILISTPMVILYFILAIMTMAGVVYWRLKHER